MQLPLEIGVVDFERATLRVEGEERSLRPLELRLLAYFAQRPEVVLSPDELLREVWGYATGVETRTLYATVNRLRLALERDPRRPFHVLTVPRLGYRFHPLAEAPPLAGALPPVPLSGDRPSGAAPVPGPAVDRAPVVEPAIPGAWGRLVGREAELDRLRALVDAHRQVLVRGPPGIGKSRLVLELALERRAAARVVRWCDLGSALDDDALVRAVARSLGVPLPPRDPAPVLAAALAALAEGVVVLDDADHVLGPLAARLAAWGSASGPTFVVTARAAGGVGAPSLAVRPLDVPGEGAAVAGCASARLLEDRLQARQPDAALADDAPWVGPLLRALGGLPLAIELAAPWLLVMGGEELLAHVADGLGGLRAPAAGAGARHRSVADAFGWSWPLLEPWQRGALAQAAAFHGPFDLRAARAVLDLGASPEAPPVHDVLLGLVEQAWLRLEARPIGQFFSFYAGQRDFLAREAPPRVLHAARGRLHAFLAALPGEGDPETLYLAGGPAWQRLRARAADLEAAFVATSGEERARLAVVLGRVLLAEGPLERCVEVAREALRVPLPEPPGAPAGVEPEPQARLAARRRRLTLRNYLAIALRNLGRPAEARAELDAALLEAAPAWALAERGRLLRAYGVLEMYHGEPLAADRHLEAARAAHRAAGLTVDEAIADAEAGTAAFLQGRLGDAIDLLERGLGVLRAQGAGWVVGVYLANLGVVELVDERLDSAASHLEEAVDLLRRLDAVRFEALALGNLALVEEKRGRFVAAHTSLDAAFALTGRTGDLGEEAALWSSRGSVLLAEARVDEAATALERAHGMAETLGIPRLVAEVLTRRARVCAARREWGHAERLVGRAADLAAERALPTERIEAEAARVEIRVTQGDPSGARAALAALEALPGVRRARLEALRARVEALGARVGAP